MKYNPISAVCCKFPLGPLRSSNSNFISSNLDSSLDTHNISPNLLIMVDPHLLRFDWDSQREIPYTLDPLGLLSGSANPIYFIGINFRGYQLSRSLRAKINFREYKLPRMAPFRNFGGINFRDRMEFWWKSLILTPFLVIFDRYFDKSYESSISRVQTFARGTDNSD